MPLKMEVYMSWGLEKREVGAKTLRKNKLQEVLIFLRGKFVVEECVLLGCYIQLLGVCLPMFHRSSIL